MKYFFYILFLSFCFGCNKYLDGTPKGYLIPSSYEDMDLVLNSLNLTTTGAANLMELSDDEDNVYYDKNSLSERDLTYIWDDQPARDFSANPALWGGFYKNISYYNTVISKISRNVTDSLGRLVLAQALVGRAYEYLYLVNLYGAVYNESSANSDLGVPWVQSVDLSSDIPKRSTIKDNYDSIIQNIESYISYLPESNRANKFRADKKSAYSILARTFLYMSRYDSAAYYANQAIVDKDVLALNELDPNADVNTYQISRFSTNIFLRLNRVSVLREYTVDTSLTKLFDDTSDFRLKLHYYSTESDDIDSLSLHSRGGIATNNYGMDINFGTTVEEMRLIIAEAAARKGDLKLALDNVNLIVENNVSPTTFKPLTATTQKIALYYVIRERRKQFAFTGLRWFDMRRLKSEGLVETINRFDGDGNVFATLTPSSLRYVLQIPQQVSEITPAIVLNPR